MAGVADGSRVGVGGALLTRLPLAAVHALAARQPRDTQPQEFSPGPVGGTL